MCNAVTNAVVNARRNNVRRFVQTRPDQTRGFLALACGCSNYFQIQTHLYVGDRFGLGAEQ